MDVLRVLLDCAMIVSACIICECFKYLLWLICFCFGLIFVVYLLCCWLLLGFAGWILLLVCFDFKDVLLNLILGFVGFDCLVLVFVNVYCFTDFVEFVFMVGFACFKFYCLLWLVFTVELLGFNVVCLFLWLIVVCIFVIRILFILLTLRGLYVTIEMFTVWFRLACFFTC